MIMLNYLVISEATYFKEHFLIFYQEQTCVQQNLLGLLNFLEVVV